jgi:hypothetical protein
MDLTRLPEDCKKILRGLHPDLYNYMMIHMDYDKHKWECDYIINGDVWYWYNMYHNNAEYMSLPKKVQKFIEIQHLFRYPDSSRTTFDRARMFSIIPEEYHEILGKLHNHFWCYILGTFQVDDKEGYKLFIGGDRPYWERLRIANDSYKLDCSVEDIFKSISY